MTKEERKIYQREYYHKNKEKRLAAANQYYMEHRTEVSSRVKARSKEQWKEIYAQRKAMLLGNPEKLKRYKEQQHRAYMKRKAKGQKND